MPISNTGQTQGIKGKFKKRDFIYNQQKDCYICPNNQCLTKRSYTKTKSNKIYFYYRANRKVCIECPIRDKCLSKTDSKTITRWESADIIDKFSNSMKTTESKNILKQRSSIVEHPFGTIKRVLGWDHFLVRGRNKVSGENALIMFTYNFKRLVNLIGVTLFRELIYAIKSKNKELIEEIKSKIEAYIYYFKLNYKNFIKYILFLEYNILSLKN